MSNDKIMFKTAAEGWFKNIKNNSKHSTYIKYCMIYHKYLEECFADKSIEELSELYLPLLFM
ncbi:MAG: hypothetical protein IJ224_05260 [Lachnospiraceae bacterium]|nr:hypothetical protein [Lachnospiraceae bacterium]